MARVTLELLKKNRSMNEITPCSQSNELL